MSRQFGGAPVGGNQNVKIALFLSFFFLLLFAALAFRLLSSSISTSAQPAAVVIREEAPKMATREVVVPLRQIERGKKLLASMFKIERRPLVGLEYGVVEDIEGVAGFYARTALLPGQPVAKDAVTTQQPNSIISQEIPPGYRAVTIRVNETSGVEGWARPGSSVDVSLIATVNGEKTITTIVENSKVLSANRNARRSEQNPDQPVPATVTLLVTTADSQKIQLGKSMGQLELTLLGDRAGERVDTPQGGTINISDLLDSSRTLNKINSRSNTLKMGGKTYLVSPSGALTLVE